ncbi:hypothetical protein DERP_003212 [Dermatophagoides pteronyssinus]|uniref:Uncharacterized protein n=1 Tax=Dermatophagoides pteronyssinus TaxID=6956 RepID=A0ABQ8JIU9_DERPT|nr:hypothetical protein DERP_003212 [Dermatophagoides pteronyssinus]
MNNRYMSIIKRNRSTLKYDHISIIPWIEIKKLHLCKNRLKIVSFSTKKLPKTIVYFEKKIFKFLLNKCNNVSYLKQVKRPWYALLFCCWNCQTFKPIKRSKSNLSSSLSSLSSHDSDNDEMEYEYPNISNEQQQEQQIQEMNSSEPDSDDDNWNLFNDNNNNLPSECDRKREKISRKHSLIHNDDGFKNKKLKQS